MTSKEEIIQLFKESVQEADPNVSVDSVTEDTDIASLGLDSVMTMEVIGIMEERLNLRFPDEDLATIRSLKDLTALVERIG
ncbi:MAG: acyl carrier protein [Myxococcota bacterium]